LKRSLRAMEYTQVAPCSTQLRHCIGSPVQRTLRLRQRSQALCVRDLRGLGCRGFSCFFPCRPSSLGMAILDAADRSVASPDPCAGGSDAIAVSVASQRRQQRRETRSNALCTPYSSSRWRGVASVDLPSSFRHPMIASAARPAESARTLAGTRPRALYTFRKAARCSALRTWSKVRFWRLIQRW